MWKEKKFHQLIQQLQMWKKKSSQQTSGRVWSFAFKPHMVELQGKALLCDALSTKLRKNSTALSTRVQMLQDIKNKI